MKRIFIRSGLLIAVLLTVLTFVGMAVLTSVGAIRSTAAGIVPPPAPPPDRTFVSAVCIDRETGEPVHFYPENAHELDWGKHSFWLYTFAVSYKTMVPGERPGEWIPVLKRVEIWTVDVVNHELVTVTVQ